MFNQSAGHFRYRSARVANHVLKTDFLNSDSNLSVSRLPAILAVLMSCAAVYMVVLLIVGLVHAYYPVPIWDEWTFVPLIERFYAGQLRLADFWAQLNEHRPFLLRILYLLDYAFFYGSKVFLFIMIYVIQATHVALLSWLLMRYADISRSARMIGVCVIVILLFSAAQTETLYWAIGVQFSAVAFFATAIFLSLGAAASRVVRNRHAVLFVALAILLATATTGTLASGILIWPLMVALALWLRLPSKYAIAIAVVGTTLIGLYLKDYEPVNIHADPIKSLWSMDKVFIYVAAYLGSPGKVLGTGACVFIGVVGFGMASATLLHLLLCREPPMHIRGALAANLIFLMATAFLTGLGRINFGLEQALSSRYITMALTFWSVLLIYWLIVLSRVPRQGSSAIQAGICAAFGLIAGIELLTQEQNSRIFLRTKPELDKASLALLLDVRAEELLNTLHWYPPQLVELAEVLRAHKLSIFSDRSFELVGHRLEDRFTLREPTKCLGFFDRVKVVRGENRFATVDGWAWDLEKEGLFDLVAIGGGDGRILGVAYTGSLRPDVVSVVPNVRSLYSGWSGLTFVGNGLLTAFGIDLTARTQCRFSEKKLTADLGLAH